MGASGFREACITVMQRILVYISQPYRERERKESSFPGKEKRNEKPLKVP